MEEAKPSSQADFRDWLFWMTDGGVRLVAVLGGFIDESYRTGSDTFSVAGALFSTEQGDRFNREWRPIYAPYPSGFKAFDLYNRRNDFAGISDATYGSLLKRSSKVLARTLLFWSGITCYARDAAAVFGSDDNGERKAYAACAANAAFMMAGFLRSNRRDDRVVYIFDRGRPGADEVDAVFSRMREFNGLQVDFCYSDHRFASRAQCPALAAPDFLAWEKGYWRTFNKDQRIAPMRDPFKRIVRSTRKDGRMYSKHLGVNSLVRHKEWLPDFWNDALCQPQQVETPKAEDAE